MQIERGYEVRVTRKSRAKGSPPEGLVCIVVAVKAGTFGTTYYLKDKEGTFYRSPRNALEVTSTEPGWKPPESFVPVIVIPQGNTFYRLTVLGPTGHIPIYPNNLYISGVQGKTIKYNKLILENDSEIEIVKDQSFAAEMTVYAYQRYIPRVQQ
jgi:hypothetical protein